MKEEGFTLLELLFVCFLLSLVALLAVPVVRMTELSRLEREAALLASDFRCLQEMSRTRRGLGGREKWEEQPQLVLEAHRYAIHFPGEAKARLEHPFPEGISALPYKGNFDGAMSRYAFYSSGEPHPLCSAIELRSAHYSIDVIIDEAGRVRTDRRRHW